MKKENDIAEKKELKKLLKKKQKTDVFRVIERIHTDIHKHEQTKSIEKYHEARARYG